MTSYGPWTPLWVDFDPQVGREQAGRRPAIVVGSALAARIADRSGCLLVVPCTSTDRNLPWQPRINLGGKPGVAMCDQLKSISVSRVVRPYAGASLEQDEIASIVVALRKLLVV